MQNALDNLQKAVNDAYSAYNLYKRKISDLENKLRHNDNISWDRYRFKVVKKIFYYMMGGIEEHYAIALAFDDFSPNLSMREIEHIWHIYSTQKTGLLLYGRSYCVHKMKQAGFKKYEIAQTLDVSNTTVSKILNHGCVID